MGTEPVGSFGFTSSAHVSSSRRCRVAQKVTLAVWLEAGLKMSDKAAGRPLSLGAEQNQEEGGLLWFPEPDWVTAPYWHPAGTGVARRW